MPPGKSCSRVSIDVHTHLREPGYEWKETVATGLSSAAHGGFGAILCMANTNPVNNDAAVTEQILRPPAARGPTVPASIHRGGHRRPQG